MIVILLLLIILLIVLYYFSTLNHDYWSKKNIKHDKPIPFFGNHIRNQFGIKSTSQIFKEVYNKFPNEKAVGYYECRTPVLVVRDLEIVRQILNVDFACFHPRGKSRNVEVEPLFNNLFNADGDAWKLLRQRLTPAFTTAKLKNMFPLVVKCAEKLQDLCEGIVSKGGECDVRDLMARFTIEFIAACGFGIETDTINHEEALFRHLGKLIFDRPLRYILYFVLTEHFPSLKKKLYISDKRVEETIITIVKAIREQRNFKPSGRNDFIDLLMELEMKGKLTGESIERRNPDGSPVEVELEMDLKLMAAQVFIFFAAGFETSSSATSFTLHQLAYHPEIQRNIQTQIDEVLSKYGNRLCYEAVAEFSLLDMAFKEAMRLFPSLGILNRVCAKPCYIPDLGITLDSGVNIVFPTQAVQNDERYFDNPHEFRPERFKPDLAKERNKYTYMPFGEGPRACIGARLGQMQSLAGLAAILHKFSVEPARNTLRHPRVNPRSNIVQSISDGLPLKLVLRNK